MQTRRYLGAFACVCALGCGGSDAPQTLPAVQGPPIALDAQLLFVDPPDQRAYLLDVSAATPAAEARRLVLPPGAASSQRRLEHDEALVLCSGTRGSATADAEPAALVAIASDGKTRSYELGTTPFDTLTQSADGRYAVMYRSSQADDRTLNNPNELVVVDLDKQPSEDGAVTRKTPDGLGHTLSQVVISPSMHIAGEDRRLLVLLSAAEVTLFDLNHLDRRATIVQLDDTRTIDPVQVVFSDTNPTLYVRAQQSDNIFMFRLEPHKPDTSVSNDFWPTINPLGGGSGPSDMALFGQGSGERLIVVAPQSGQASVIDPSSSKTTNVTLQAPAEQILTFQAKWPNDTMERTRALLYSSKRSDVTFFDVENLGDDPQEQLDVVATPEASSGLIPLYQPQDRDGKVALLFSQSVALIDLAQHTQTLILTGAALNGALFDSSNERLWANPTSSANLGTLDLTTGMTDEIPLAAPSSALVPLFSIGRIAAIHTSSIGYLTLLDVADPSPRHALSLRGFFVSGALDRGTP